MKTNNPISAFALHILNNRHEYRNTEHTMQLSKTCIKGNLMNCWESFNMQVLQHQNLLIDEQKTSEPKPIYALANITKQHITQSDTHSDSVQARPAQE